MTKDVENEIVGHRLVEKRNTRNAFLLMTVQVYHVHFRLMREDTFLVAEINLFGKLMLNVKKLFVISLHK